MRAKSSPVVLVVAAVAMLCIAPNAAAYSSYYTDQCAACHTPALVGSSANTCNGCHAHGTHASSAKTSINVRGATDASTYSPGQTVNVTIAGGYRTGWIRAVLYDQDMKQLAVSTGPSGMGGGASLPVTLSAPAPTLAGSYTWNVAWYGNRYEAAAGVFGARWVDDPDNHDHGWEIVATNTFTVSAPTAPSIAFVPPSLDFGTMTMGTSASLPTQLQNTGTGVLTVAGIALCTGTHPDFSWSAPPLPFTVAPGASTTVTVTYAPTHPGTHPGCIAFTSNAANAPVANLAINGTAVAPSAPVADVDPLSLDLGVVTVGSSSTRTFTVGNPGTAPLTVAIARATGTSAEYVASPTTFTVDPGGSTVVTATYAPVDVGTDGGSFLVQTNDPIQPSVPVVLTGSGAAAPTPHLVLSPGSLDLGGVTVGGSASLGTAVGNSGTAPLVVSAITRCAGTSAEFTWSPAAPFTVAVGGATTLTVTYAPSGAGADAGCLALASDDPSSPITNLTVQGTGIAPAAPRIAVAPQALAFGSVTVGLGADRTFTVSNSGNATLTGTVTRAAGTSAEFTIAPAGFSLTPGTSQLVTVTYTPGAVGADGGSLSVASNDPSTPTVAVSLSGTGVTASVPSIALDPPSVSFGPVVTGSTGSAPVAVRNTGSAPLEVSAITRCSGTSTEFAWSPSAPFQVAAGASATVTATYMPADLGADSGCLTFASNDPSSPMVNLSLAGSGVAVPVPSVALVPPSLDFGTVTIGGSASRTSQVTNAGTGTLHVSSVTACSGTSAEFSWTPAGPFDVAPGGSVALAVAYAPADVGPDEGCLSVASDDPATPSAALRLAGTGAQPPVAGGDIDIDELEVPEKIDAEKDRRIAAKVHLRNRGSAEATGTAQLTATRDGATIYDQSLSVTLRARGDEEFTFPPLTVAAGTSGTILWTLQVTDEAPDTDVATARTRVGNDDDGRDDDERDDLRASSATGVSGSASGPTTGCSTGGGSALGLLLALGALLVPPARRRP